MSRRAPVRNLLALVVAIADVSNALGGNPLASKPR
jgi:hypothetical protein